MIATTTTAMKKSGCASSSVWAPPATGTLKRKAPPELRTAGTATNEEAAMTSSHILKLKKEAFASNRLWRDREMRNTRTPGGMQRWLKARAAVAKAEETQEPTKKRKVIVKNEMLSSRSAAFVIRKYVDGKWVEYLGALVEQSERLGYAEDEDEVSDDEDEYVVKMRALAIGS